MPRILIEIRPKIQLGERIWQIAENASALKERDYRDQGYLIEMFEEAIELLRSLPEYSEHREAAYPNDFAFLPNEVIYDVVAVAKQEHTANDLRHLKCLQGLWGEYGRKIFKEVQSLVQIRFKKSKFLAEIVDYDEEELTLEEARDHFIYHSEIDKNVHVSQLSAVAPKLYEKIEFRDVTDLPSDILARIGSRFSSVKWEVKSSLTPQVVDFLKRQLRSKHLRQLRICALGFQKGELDDLLVDFVQRPLFESLELYGSYNEGKTTAHYKLPFEAIKGAYENWNSRTLFEVGKKQIFGSVSHESFDKIKEFFMNDTNLDCSETESVFNVVGGHPSIRSARMKLGASLQPAHFLGLTFSGLKTTERED